MASKFFSWTANAVAVATGLFAPYPNPSPPAAPPSEGEETSAAGSSVSPHDGAATPLAGVDSGAEDLACKESARQNQKEEAGGKGGGGYGRSVEGEGTLVDKLVTSADGKGTRDSAAFPYLNQGCVQDCEAETDEQESSASRERQYQGGGGGGGRGRGLKRRRTFLENSESGPDSRGGCLACAGEDAAVLKGALEGSQKCRPIWITLQEYQEDVLAAMERAGSVGGAETAAAGPGEEVRQQQRQRRHYCDHHRKGVGIASTEVPERVKEEKRREDREGKNNQQSAKGPGGPRKSGGAEEGGGFRATTEVAGPDPATVAGEKAMEQATGDMKRAVPGGETLQAAFKGPAARTSSITTPLTVGEKKALSTTINSLGHDELEAVVEIIRRRTPLERPRDGRDFVELSLDAIDVVTLRSLQTFVAEVGRQRVGGSGSKHSSHGIPPEKVKEKPEDRVARGSVAQAEFSTGLGGEEQGNSSNTAGTDDDNSNEKRARTAADDDRSSKNKKARNTGGAGRAYATIAKAERGLELCRASIQKAEKILADNDKVTGKNAACSRPDSGAGAVTAVGCAADQAKIEPAAGVPSKSASTSAAAAGAVVQKDRIGREGYHYNLEKENGKDIYVYRRGSGASPEKKREGGEVQEGQHGDREEERVDEAKKKEYSGRGKAGAAKEPEMSRAGRRAAEREAAKETAKEAAKAARAERLRQQQQHHQRKFGEKQRGSDARRVEGLLLAKAGVVAPPATTKKKTEKSVKKGGAGGGGGTLEGKQAAAAAAAAAQDKRNAAAPATAAGSLRPRVKSSACQTVVEPPPLGRPADVGANPRAKIGPNAAYAVAQSPALAPVPAIAGAGSRTAKKETAPASSAYRSSSPSFPSPPASSGETPSTWRVSRSPSYRGISSDQAPGRPEAAKLRATATFGRSNRREKSGSLPNGGEWMWPRAITPGTGDACATAAGNQRVSPAHGDSARDPEKRAVGPTPFVRLAWIGRAAAETDDTAPPLPWGNWRRWREPEKWEKMVGTAITRYSYRGVQRGDEP